MSISRNIDDFDPDAAWSAVSAPSGGDFDPDAAWQSVQSAQTRATPEALAAEEERQRTGKRKQFDGNEPSEWDWTAEDTAIWKDIAAPFHDPDARRQIKDPELGTAASVAAAMESIPVSITNLGATPVDENPNASASAQLSQGLGGGIARAALTAPLGPVAFGAGEAVAKTADIATDDPMAFTERPGGTAGRIAAAGLIPGAASKVAGAVVPRVMEAAPAAVKWLAGTLAGSGVEFAGNEAQKGIEYIGGAEDPTLAGFGEALKPTAQDMITLAPGVAGSAIQARRALAGAVESPEARPMPRVLFRPDTRDTPLDPYQFSARAEGIREAEQEIFRETGLGPVPQLGYTPPTARARVHDYGPADLGPYPPEHNVFRSTAFQQGTYKPDVPNFVMDKSTPPEGTVRPDEAEVSPMPTRQERQGDPSISGSAKPAQGTDDPRFIGGFNKRLFGMDDNPELQNVYKQQAERAGETPRGPTRVEVAERAKSVPDMDIDSLRKIQTMDDARGMLPEQRQALSRQKAMWAQKELDGPGLSADDEAFANELHRTAKLARGVPGSDLSLLNQSAIDEAASAGNFKLAAKMTLDDMDPSGKAPKSAVDALRDTPDDPLEIARTTFKESRRYHSFIHNLQIANLLSNVIGTGGTNIVSSLANFAAESAGQSPTTYGKRIAGVPQGLKEGASRAKFAFKEGFGQEALTNPRIAAEAPGFALGGAANPLNWGGRTAFSGDEFVSGLAQRTHLNVLADAMAKRDAAGDAGEFSRLSEAYRANPPKELLDEAKEFARRSTYKKTDDSDTPKVVSEIENAVSMAINAGINKGTRAEIKPIKLAGIPFWTTVLKVAKANVRYSPLGAAGTVYKGATGKITPGQVAARLALASVPVMVGKALSDAGVITGPMPKDEAEREAFIKAGKSPWSLNFGDKFHVPLMYFGPFAVSLGAGAALKEAQRKAANGKISDDQATIAGETIANTYRLFSESSPIITLNSMVNVLADPNEGKLKKWLADFGSQFVPMVSMQGFLNRQNVVEGIRDPYMRDTAGENALEEIWNRIVGKTVAARTLPVRPTSLGTDSERNAVLTSDPDPVYAELYDLGIYPSQPDRNLPKVAGALRAEEMTPEEYRELLRAGAPTYSLIRQHMSAQSWASQDRTQKQAVMKAIFQRALSPVREAKKQQIGARRLAGAPK